MNQRGEFHNNPSRKHFRVTGYLRRGRASYRVARESHRVADVVYQVIAGQGRRHEVEATIAHEPRDSHKLAATRRAVAEPGLSL